MPTSLRAVLSSCLLLLAIIAHALPTGLNVMPTANTLTSGEFRIDFEDGGTAKLFVFEGNALAGLQVGLPMGFEVGADFLVGEGTVYNAKWRLIGSPTTRTQAAIGAQNLASGRDPQYYLVVTSTLDVQRTEGQPLLRSQVHAGVLRDIDGASVLLLGVNGAFDRLIFAADIANGSDRDRAALGIGIQFGSLRIMRTSYNMSDTRESTYTFSYSYGE